MSPRKIVKTWESGTRKFGTISRNRPKLGRFQKDVVLDRSKGIGGLARPRQSWIGYWFGRPRRHGDEIDENRVLNFGGPTVKINETLSTSRLSSLRMIVASRGAF